MTLVIILCIIIMLCLLAQGFFAASEMALISLDYIRIKNKADKGNGSARIILFFLEHPKLLFGTTLLGVNVAIILNAVSASFLTRTILEMNKISIPYQVQSIISTSIIVPLILFFGEIVPMGFSRLHPEWIISRGIHLFRTLYLILYPLVKVTSMISSVISRITGADVNTYASLTTRKELESYISNSFSASETSPVFNIEKIINDTFMFSKTPARDIMTPLSEVKAIPDTAAIKDMWKFAGEHGHSRLPIYGHTKENITGYVYVTDLIGEDADCPLIDKMLPPLIISETITLPKLLSLMKTNGAHIAFATDHAGTISGIITDEDIIENIFGHIYDEHDRNGKENTHPNYIIAHPDIKISDINSMYNLGIPESEHYSTLTGCILHNQKKMPLPGTAVALHGLVITIEEVENNKITKVSIVKNKEVEK